MSNTYKTDPWWVKAKEWEPVHNRLCPNRTPVHTYVWSGSPDPDFVCDLPEEPVVQNPRRPRSWRHSITDATPTGYTACWWEPVIGSYYGREGRKIYGVERGLHISGNLFERGVRAQWRKARGRLLGTIGCQYGDTCCCQLDEDCIPDPRHRHFAIWDRF